MVRLKEEEDLLYKIKKANFNSSMVRLKAGGATVLSQSQILFQFQYGSIKRKNRRRWRIPRWRFQFQYGSIKSCPNISALVSSTDFNSSMVRLKAYKVDGIIMTDSFQFQYGSIKSTQVLISHRLFSHFNSSMVRLKAPFEVYIPTPLPHFNSSMVRLKGYFGELITTDLERFQFQYGSIKSTVSILNYANPTDFNSSMVRLKVLCIRIRPGTSLPFQFQYGSIKSSLLRTAYCLRDQISIPVWFD